MFRDKIPRRITAIAIPGRHHSRETAAFGDFAVGVKKRRIDPQSVAG